jgi:hypothetical protein
MRIFYLGWLGKRKDCRDCDNDLNVWFSHCFGVIFGGRPEYVYALLVCILNMRNIFLDLVKTIFSSSRESITLS